MVPMIQELPDSLGQRIQINLFHLDIATRDFFIAFLRSAT